MGSASMNSSVEQNERRRSRRLWHGGLGAFVGAVLGLIVAGYLHLNLVDGVLYGSIAGFLIGFLFGVDAIERLMSWWP